MAVVWTIMCSALLAVPRFGAGVSHGSLPSVGPSSACELMVVLLSMLVVSRLRFSIARLAVLGFAAGVSAILGEVFCGLAGLSGDTSKLIPVIEGLLYTLALSAVMCLICIGLNSGDSGAVLSKSRRVIVPTCLMLSGAAWYLSVRAVRIMSTDMRLNVALILALATMAWALPAVGSVCAGTREKRDSSLWSCTMLLGVFLGNRVWALLQTMGVVWIGFGGSTAVSIALSVAPALSIAALLGAFCGQVRREEGEDTAQRAEGDEGAGALDSLLAQLSGIETLSKQELRVLRMSAAGVSASEIGQRLALATSTVGTYRMRAYQKLGLASRQELIEALRSRLENEPVGRGGSGDSVEKPVERRERSDLEADGERVIAAVAFGASAGVCLALLALCPGTYRGVVQLGSLGLICLLAWRATSRHGVLRSAQREGLAGLAISAVSFMPPDQTLAQLLCAPVLLLFFSAVGLVIGETASREVSSRAMAAVSDAVLWGEDRLRSYLAGRGLSSVQAEVVILSAYGFSQGRISEALFIASSTVSNYRTKAYRVLGVHGRDELLDLLGREAGFCLRRSIEGSE